MPSELAPERPDAPAPARSAVATSWLALVTHWRLVVAELAFHQHVDLYDPTVLARPWPGVRTMIFDLLDRDTRLRAALTVRQEVTDGPRSER